MCGTLAQGCKDPRLDGDEHMEAVEEFCLSAQKQWPNCLIQFEDFPTDKVPAIARSQTIPTMKVAWRGPYQCAIQLTGGISELAPPYRARKVDVCSIVAAAGSMLPCVGSS